METTDNGFDLAEKDLELRGAGEYFGRRQSGAPDLRFAKLTDAREIMAARTEAQRLLEEDPDLTRPEHAAIAAAVSSLWDRVTSDVS
jgi:ATP-dependent DNA helicase RecG